MMNPKKPKKIEGEAVRIAEPDSSTEPCEVLISKLSPTKDERKIKYVVKPNYLWGGNTSTSELTSDTAGSADIEVIDWPSATHYLKQKKPQDLEKNEDLNEKMARKYYVSEQAQDLTWRREPEEFLQEDVIVISDTENP